MSNSRMEGEGLCSSICYALEENLSLGLGGCEEKWPLQPGQAVSEKASCGDGRWRWSREVVQEVLWGTWRQVGKWL